MPMNPPPEIKSDDLKSVREFLAEDHDESHGSTAVRDRELPRSVPTIRHGITRARNRSESTARR